MCGRYSLTADKKELEEQFEVECGEELPQRYNIAPSQDIAIVRTDPEVQGRFLVKAQWGLLPKWAKDFKDANRPINARAETLMERKTFQGPFKYRRCLIPASGFYEWKAGGGRKQPYYIRLKDNGLFAFAGLWEQWQKGDEIIIDSAVIITTDPNSVMRRIHNRMPVILSVEHYKIWLDPKNNDTKSLTAILKPYDPESMTAYPVGPRVNSPGNDDSACIEREQVFRQN